MTVEAATPWPVIIFWAVIVLFARAAGRKKRPVARSPQTPARRPDDARVELGDALQRAMEKLRQAERAARPPVRASKRLQLEDHSDQSQETEPEVVDYDDDATRLKLPPIPEPEAPSARLPVRPSARLARFADGSLKGAIILGEILSRPIGDR